MIAENAKEMDFINGVRTPTEKAIVLLVDAFAEGRESRGMKISPNVASFAKKAKNPNVTNNDWKYIPSPKKEQITGFEHLIKVTPKTSNRGGKLRDRWKDPDGNIFEWDSQHGTLEKYNKRGKHLGEFDYKTGKQTKPADPNRRVEP